MAFSSDHISTLNALSWSQCRAEIIAGSVDGTVRRFDVRMGRQYIDDVHQPVTCVALSHDANCLLVACMDSCMRLLDRAEGDLLAEYKGAWSIGPLARMSSYVCVLAWGRRGWESSCCTYRSMR